MNKRINRRSRINYYYTRNSDKINTYNSIIQKYNVALTLLLPIIWGIATVIVRFLIKMFYLGWFSHFKLDIIYFKYTEDDLMFQLIIALIAMTIIIFSMYHIPGIAYYKKLCLAIFLFGLTPFLSNRVVRMEEIADIEVMYVFGSFLLISLCSLFLGLFTLGACLIVDLLERKKLIAVIIIPCILVAFGLSSLFSYNFGRYVASQKKAFEIIQTEEGYYAVLWKRDNKLYLEKASSPQINSSNSTLTIHADNIIIKDDIDLTKKNKRFKDHKIEFDEDFVEYTFEMTMTTGAGPYTAGIISVDGKDYAVLEHLFPNDWKNPDGEYYHLSPCYFDKIADQEYFVIDYELVKIIPSVYTEMKIVDLQKGGDFPADIETISVKEFNRLKTEQ